MKIIEINKDDKKFPKQLKIIKNAPKKLYVLGNINLLTNENIVAIVGSRTCSRYGMVQGHKFAKELAKAGITVVSGMALGIDSVAHLGAVGESGNTIAVLGSGFNHIFPKENEYLFYKILNQGGCIISEYMPNEKEQSSNFPKRNRIISGLASKVLIIEAGRRSGSLITARLAKEQQKEVFALPSDLDIIGSQGGNELILNGATIALNPGQIISKMITANVGEGFHARPRKTKIQNEIEIPNQYKKIYQILQKEDMHINEISKELKISLPEISSTITIMELEGYIEKTDKNQYKIKESQS